MELAGVRALDRRRVGAPGTDEDHPHMRSAHWPNVKTLGDVVREASKRAKLQVQTPPVVDLPSPLRSGDLLEHDRSAELPADAVANTDGRAGSLQDMVSKRCGLLGRITTFGPLVGGERTTAD